MFYFAMKQPDAVIGESLTVNGNFFTMPFFYNNQIYTSANTIFAGHKTENYGKIGTIGQYIDGTKQYSMQVATDGKIPPFAYCFPSKIFGSQSEISSENVVPIPTKKIKGTWYIDFSGTIAPNFPAFCGCELSGKFKSRDGVETPFTYISGVPHYGNENHYFVKAENDAIANDMYPYAIFGDEIKEVWCSVTLLKNVGNVHREEDFITESIQMTGWLNNELVSSVRHGYLIFETEQDIPEVIYNWITKISTRIEENIIEIKNADGTIKRGEIKTIYQNHGINLKYQGDVATAKVQTIAPGIIGELSWTPSQSGSGISFLGLSYNKNAKVPDIKMSTGYYPLPTSNEIVLYEVWAKPEPVPAGTVVMAIYKSSAEKNKVDKTSEIKLWTTPFIQGTLKQSCSMIDPVILFEFSAYPDFNYVQIPQFGNRYYFVVGITSVQKNIWEISMKCDVLMTYKQRIKAMQAVVARQEFNFDPDLRDENASIPAERVKMIRSSKIKSPFDVTSGQGTISNIALTVFRGV